MEVTLYSTGCPKCKVLKKKLEAANINYTEVTDTDKVYQICKSTGLDSVPIIAIEDGHILDFNRAIAWVKQVGDNNA
jgi:glutaredoxin